MNEFEQKILDTEKWYADLESDLETEWLNKCTEWSRAKLEHFNAQKQLAINRRTHLKKLRAEYEAYRRALYAARQADKGAAENDEKICD